MISEEEKLVATLATRMYTRWNNVSVEYTVELAKEIIEASRLPDNNPMPSRKPRLYTGPTSTDTPTKRNDLMPLLDKKLSELFE